MLKLRGWEGVALGTMAQPPSGAFTGPELKYLGKKGTGKNGTEKKLSKKKVPVRKVHKMAWIGKKRY